MNDYTDRLIFVISLPRSRTAWLCEFFDKFLVTWHDPLKRCESIDELGRKVDRALAGREARLTRLMIADTAACFFMREIVERFPGAKFIVIDRPYVLVCASLKRQGVFSLTMMTATVSAFLNWDMHLPKDRTFVFRYEWMNIILENIAQFMGVQIVPVQWTEYKNSMVLKNVQKPFARQNAETDWAKVRKLLKGKFDFRNDSRLMGD